MGQSSSRESDSDMSNILTFALPDEFRFQSLADMHKVKLAFSDTVAPHWRAKLTTSRIRWNDVKASGDVDFLAQYGTFRGLFVNGVLQLAAKQVECINRCRAFGVGSVSLVSDYDISVYGMRATHIVEKFNELFGAVWDNVASADIFDTNIYGATYFFPQLSGNYGIFASGNGPCKKNFLFIDVNNQHDSDNQRMWATLKMYRYAEHVLPDLQWFNKDLINAIQNRLLTCTGGVPVDTNNNKIMNDLYEQRLEELPTVEAAFNTAGGCDSVNRKGSAYKQQIALSTFYGNETYFTQGAFFHVVGQMQSGLNPPVTPAEYVDSIIENIGDFLKEGLHVQHGGGQQTTLMFMVMGSKYLARVADALNRMMVDKVPQLQAAVQNADEIKRTLRQKRDFDENDVRLIGKLMAAFHIPDAAETVPQVANAVVAFVQTAINAMELKLPFGVLGAEMQLLDVSPDTFVKVPPTPRRPKTRARSVQ